MAQAKGRARSGSPPHRAQNARVSTGRTRFLDERVLRFLNKYADHATIIDAAELKLEERLGKHVAEFFNSVVMIPIERYYVSVMADERGRSMDDRTYMWKVEY